MNRIPPAGSLELKPQMHAVRLTAAAKAARLRLSKDIAGGENSIMCGGDEHG